MSNQNLQERLDALKTQYTKEKTTLDLYAKQKTEKEQELNSVQKAQSELLTMKELLEKASNEARENGKQILAQTASSSLQLVMGNNLMVDIELGHKSGVPIADLEIVTQYGTQQNRINPADEGGGIRDLVSLSTFMATGFLTGENNTAPYFLDEPTKFVSEEYHELAAHAIKEIVDYSKKQAIVVTHEKHYLPMVANVAYELSKDDTGSTQVIQVV